MELVTRSSVYVNIRLGDISQYPSSSQPEYYPRKVLAFLYEIAPRTLSAVSPITLAHRRINGFTRFVRLLLAACTISGRVRCDDSSLFPSLTLRWAVITCYASLWSSEVPLVSIALTSVNFKFHHFFKFC